MQHCMGDLDYVLAFLAGILGMSRSDIKVLPGNFLMNGYEVKRATRLICRTAYNISYNADYGIRIPCYW